jgi:23S rRNA pseudouridine2605 synthase
MHDRDQKEFPPKRQEKSAFSPKSARSKDAGPTSKPTLKDVKSRQSKAFEPKDIQDRRDGVRIAKVLARAGIASRREVERLISLGHVAVNGRILDKPAVLIKETDVVTVEGRVVGKAEATRVFRYHKPVGLLTTHADNQGRETVFANLPEGLPRVISVGRLDINSEGLLLLTNDGELARKLELPSSKWIRRYRARCLGQTTQGILDSLRQGTTIDGVHYGPMDAKIDKAENKNDGRANLWISVAITEGKNREVRKVLESINLRVNRLIRLSYGSFVLGDLAAGDVEEIGPSVVREILGDLIAPTFLPPSDQVQTLYRPSSSGPGRRGGGDRFGSKNNFKPRTPREGSFDDGPRKKPWAARGEGDASASRPAFKPRTPREGSFDDGPRKKPWAARGEGDPSASQPAFKPRTPREGSFDDGPRKKPWAPRGEDGKSYRQREDAGDKKPYRPKDRPEFNPKAEGERRRDEGVWKRASTQSSSAENKAFKTRAETGERPASRSAPRPSSKPSYQKSDRSFQGSERPAGSKPTSRPVSRSGPRSPRPKV